jgi:FKBP-type peptidyl-prolyl cis-trans isomerase
MRINLIISLILLIACAGCRRYNTQQLGQDMSEQERVRKETLMRVNRQLVENDVEAIKAFVEKTGWDMQVSESGLWYSIYQRGTGEKAVTGKVAELAYTVSLLDSTVCYSSEKLGVKEFRTGQGGVEAGLEEGVLLLRIGDKARFIMPPHLAHGLTGDGLYIPARAVIIYDVELLNLK